MNELDFALDTKAINDDGYIEGLAVGYGNLDRGGDIVLPGAIRMGSKTLPMLMYHDQKRPAGVWTDFEDTADGLLAKGRFSMSTRNGKEAHGLVKDGALGGLSMGYQPIKHQIVGKARHLVEVELHEVSLVTIPMNAKTLITGFKSIEDVREAIARGDNPPLDAIEDLLREAGFPRSLATAFVSLGKGAFRQGDPGAETDIKPAIDPAAFWAALRDAPVIDLTE